MNPQKYSMAHDLGIGEPTKFLFNFTFFNGINFSWSLAKYSCSCVGITFLSWTLFRCEIKFKFVISYLSACIYFSIKGTLTLPVLPPESSVAIPLRCTSWDLYLRPHGVGVGFCSQPIEWRNVLRSHTTVGCSRECCPVSCTVEAGQKFRYEDLLLVMLTALPEEVWFAHFLRSSKLQPWSRDDQVYVARRTSNLNVFQQDF